MGRAKQRMELITNKKIRCQTFEKRKKSMLKKACELKTLCDVEVCTIIYGPKINNLPVEAEIWPSCNNSVNCLINSYRSQSSKVKANMTLDLSDFFQDRNQKIEDEVAKLRKKNSQPNYPTWDDRYNSFTKENLMEFEHMLENMIQHSRFRLEAQKSQNHDHVQWFYGQGNVQVNQPSYWVNYINPLPYGADGGCNSNSLAAMMVMPPEDYSPMSMYDPNIALAIPTVPPELLYNHHLQMASSQAQAVQMEDYYRSGDMQMNNSWCNNSFFLGDG